MSGERVGGTSSSASTVPTGGRTPRNTYGTLKSKATISISRWQWVTWPVLRPDEVERPLPDIW